MQQFRWFSPPHIGSMHTPDDSVLIKGAGQAQFVMSRVSLQLPAWVSPELHAGPGSSPAQQARWPSPPHAVMLTQMPAITPWLGPQKQSSSARASKQNA
jgi:hypothetical protein